MPPETRSPDASVPPVPAVLCQTRHLAAAACDATSVLWKLDGAERQLDANLIRLPPHGRIEAHREPDLDVLLLVVAGDGVLGAGVEDTPLPVGQGTLLSLPYGSTRSITAGRSGIAYLTVHRRRPGMQIRPAPARTADA